MIERKETGRRYAVPRILGCLQVGTEGPILAGSVIGEDGEAEIQGQETHEYDFGSGDFYADWD